jgi:hypothetical protein
MVAKSFTRKQVLIKNFHQKFFAEYFLWLQNNFLENWVFTKNFHKKVLNENFS